MYTFTMVGCTLFKFCHFKCVKSYLLQILGMSRLWHDLMAHGPVIFSSVTHMRTVVLLQCKEVYQADHIQIYEVKLNGNLQVWSA